MKQQPTPSNVDPTTPLVKKAIQFAEKSYGHMLRKYSNEPYMLHPLRVYDTVLSVTDDENILVSAILHDVLECTAVRFDDLVLEFGDTIAQMVADQTCRYAPWYMKFQDGLHHQWQQLRSPSTDCNVLLYADMLDDMNMLDFMDKDNQLELLFTIRYICGFDPGGDLGLRTKLLNDIQLRYKCVSVGDDA